MRLACRPMRENVAWTRSRANRASTCGVQCGSGPSSTVSATAVAPAAGSTSGSRKAGRAQQAQGARLHESTFHRPRRPTSSRAPGAEPRRLPRWRLRPPTGTASAAGTTRRPGPAIRPRCAQHPFHTPVAYLPESPAPGGKRRDTPAARRPAATVRGRHWTGRDNDRVQVDILGPLAFRRRRARGAVQRRRPAHCARRCRRRLFERPWSITLISSEKASASSRYWVVSGTATSERSSSTEAYWPVRPIMRRTWSGCRTASMPASRACPRRGAAEWRGSVRWAHGADTGARAAWRQSPRCRFCG